MKRSVHVLIAGTALAGGACTGSSPAEPSPSVTSPAPDATHTTHGRALPPRATAGQIDGRAFPDHVLALTWDDGPDAQTMELATYLYREKVGATFFVVGAWVEGLSADPGLGKDVFATGHDFLPILGDLVAMGHRLGNHTLNHVLLWGADPSVVDRQLRANQQRVDPFLTSELRLFRAPGGAWDGAAAGVVANDPYLKQLVGPVRWDVDRKDWEESVECGSSRARRDDAECERAGPGGALRLKAHVTAQRYLSSIDRAGRGIVLLHDRVGHVGSDYALDVARALVPQLKARGYVFAAPVLEFSPLATRLAANDEDCSESERERAIESATVRIADVDGDGRADLCARSQAGLVCAPSTRVDGAGGDRMPRMAFGATKPWAGALGSSFDLADVDGDGRADLCLRRAGEIACALADERGGFGDARRWSADPAEGAELRFGDVDGDGRADACARVHGGIACARSLGTAFEAPRAWLAEAGDPGAAFELADVTGDGRADLCARGARAADGVMCAPSHGDAFVRMEAWGPRELDGALFADLNGDGRADACARRAGESGGIACAFSTGHAFTRPTIWLKNAGALRDVRLGDVSGDGRADLCASSDAGVVCAMAP